MRNNSLLIYVTHGTYGRDDDAFGALLAANSALAKGLNVSLVFFEEGVALAKDGQNPNNIGLPNNLNEIRDFIDLGGKLFVEDESLIDRGISKDELIKEAKIVSQDEIVELIGSNNISLTF